MKKRLSFLFYVAILIAWIASSMAMEVYAEEIYVTRRVDNVAGSLRAAITTANTNNEADTIYLPGGSFILTGNPGEDGNAEGDLDFDSSHKITIIGHGSETTLIDAFGGDRVLHILKGTVSITGVTIMSGKTPDADYLQDSEVGGGIKNNGTLILNQCTIRENSTGMGGRTQSGAWDEIAGSSGSGGGIYNSGSLTLTLCGISMNITGQGGGGGLYQTGGESGNGGAIFNSGTLTITDCTIGSNYTGKGGEACGGGDSGSGAGIYNSSTGKAIIKKSTITNNSTSEGGYADCAGGPFHGGNGGNGGGIYNEGEINLTNCTISDNDTGIGGSTDSAPLGIGGSGGGIYNKGDASLRCCTVAHNSINNCYPDRESGNGGGIYSHVEGSIYIVNTIVANNEILNSNGKGPDCYGTLRSLGYNLFENTSYCFIEGDTTEDITGIDPKLGKFADNGGPTQTYELLFGSPAIDAGNSQGVSQDQRGYTRPQDIPGFPNVIDGSDIGAYELVPIFTISGRITSYNNWLTDVTLTFSNNGGTTSTNENGFYSHPVPLGWSGKVTPTKEGYTFKPASMTYDPVQADCPDGDYRAEPVLAPKISVNRTQLNYGIDNAGNQTGTQTFLIANSGGGILNWTVEDNVSWLYCFPMAGKNSGAVTASINTGALSPGTYSGVITVSCPQASNSPLTIDITLVVYKASASGVPFGYFETPTDGASVYSSIPVTGWVLDNIGVDSVKIYREENKNLSYIGDAIFVEDARPDVEQAYPHYPFAYKAGWGYMMLTNFLPNGGNGRFILVAIAVDKEGNQVTLGKKTVAIDNAHAVKPFGAIDTPAQGGSASGVKYRNQGWALTPLPNKIPEDGHTIKVWIDGVKAGNPVYNIYRSDIATLFPGYANSSGAMAYFDFDTSGYENGVHTIEWTAVDNAGNTDGIGSRYFSIQNADQGQAQSSGAGNRGMPATREMPLTAKDTLDIPLSQIPRDYSEPIRCQKGYQTGNPLQTHYPDNNGNIAIETKELMRIEIHLEGYREPSANSLPNGPGNEALWRGYHLVGDQLRRLPIGSCLETGRGIFCWQPGPGFIGAYQLVFIKETAPGEYKKKLITIHLRPKF